MRDGALPTLLSVVDMIEREFPQTIVDHVDAATLNFEAYKQAFYRQREVTTLTTN